jgi:hypothetical protein
MSFILKDPHKQLQDFQSLPVDPTESDLNPFKSYLAGRFGSRA